MRTAEHVTETEQVHRLSENLMSHLAKGREWATPGVQAALQRAVAGLDTGIESASPHLQTLLRRLADELAGGVETLTPQVQERLRRIGPKTAAEVTATVPVEAAPSAPRTFWWIGGLLAMIAAGVAVSRSLKASGEGAAQESGGADLKAEADLAAGQI
ncbi:hypothetical protein [Arthrobacter sp. ZGTC412]|uniref:hypothetical protein n=1 Tax=Arthrobacter sp. ZGTC412 TaxID=2058900 RepID=UPI000CE50A26|nr:hypothetical protein [Arthrobacter sp. ZGTC412]